jgi:hypothetical protein
MKNICISSHNCNLNLFDNILSGADNILENLLFTSYRFFNPLLPTPKERR